MTATVIQIAVVVISGIAVIAAFYIGLGGKKLWGPERGVPWCSHAFYLTYRIEPTPQVWTCPKCLTEFVPRDGRWVVKR